MNETKVIELFGLPEAGKTTSAEAVNKFINRQTNYRSRIITERASQCPIEDKLHPLFNFWTVTSLIKEYIEAIDQDYDVLIADRGINDAIIWINYFNRNDEYSNYWDSFLRLIDNNFVKDAYLCTLYFTADIEIILDRECRRQIIGNPGQIVNKRVLSGYKDSFKDLSINNSLFFNNPTIIDTSNSEIDKMIDKVSGIVNKIL